MNSQCRPRKAWPLVACVLLQAAAFADESAALNEARAYRAATPVQIDGVLDDAVWREAAPLGTRRGEQVELTTWALRDEGGGRLLLPGPFSAGSRVLDQQTDVTFGRLRWNHQRFSAAIEWSDRRGEEYRNSLAGLDLAWQPGDSDRVSAQWLTSDTTDPLTNPVLDADRGTAWRVRWERSAERFIWDLRDTRIDGAFRGDSGFMPLADLHEHFAKAGMRCFELGFMNEIQPYVGWLDQGTLDGSVLIERGAYPAVYFLGPRNLNGFVELHLNDEARALAVAPVRSPSYVRFDAAINPLPSWPKLRLYGDVGQLLDYGTGDLRRGYQLTGNVLLRPTDHIELEAELSGIQLSDRDSGATVVRENNQTLTAIYHFTAALNCRVQWIHESSARFEPDESHSHATTATFVLSYRPSWCTTGFLGTSRAPELAGGDYSGRWFLKLSHAFGG